MEKYTSGIRLLDEYIVENYGPQEGDDWDITPQEQIKLEGAFKKAWNHQQKKIDELCAKLKLTTAGPDGYGFFEKKKLDMPIKRRHLCCHNIPIEFPTRKEWFAEQYYHWKMIPKSELENVLYVGTCRNAKLAMWCPEADCFVHERTKFGHSFLEDIKHPEDEFEGYDVFIPHAKFSDLVSIASEMPTETGRRYWPLPKNVTADILSKSGFFGLIAEYKAYSALAENGGLGKYLKNLIERQQRHGK